MESLELLDKVSMLKNALLAQVGGSNESANQNNAEYETLRSELIAIRVRVTINASFNCVRHFNLHKCHDLKPHSVQDAF
jgi:hypothetical protein